MIPGDPKTARDTLSRSGSKWGREASKIFEEFQEAFKRCAQSMAIPMMGRGFPNYQTARAQWLESQRVFLTHREITIDPPLSLLCPCGTPSMFFDRLYTVRNVSTGTMSTIYRCPDCGREARRVIGRVAPFKFVNPIWPHRVVVQGPTIAELGGAP